MSGAGLKELRRREKDRVSRAHILDAAERVFGQKGFHVATLREIADEAEFSVGALYGFFDGKDDLFVQVLERQGTALLDEQRSATAGESSARRRLHLVADAQVAYFRERPDFYRLVQRELGGVTWSLRASLNERALERYHEVLSFEADIFRDGIASGDLRGDDPEVQAALFSGLMQAYLGQWVHALDAGVDLDDVYGVDALHELIDRAFAAPGDP